MMEDFRNEENRQHVKNDISALTGDGNMAMKHLKKFLRKPLKKVLIHTVLYLIHGLITTTGTI